MIKNYIYASGIAICRREIRNLKGLQISSGQAIKYKVFYDTYEDIFRVAITTFNNTPKKYSLTMDEKIFDNYFKIFTINKNAPYQKEVSKRI